MCREDVAVGERWCECYKGEVLCFGCIVGIGDGWWWWWWCRPTVSGVKCFLCQVKRVWHEYGWCSGGMVVICGGGGQIYFDWVAFT